ncbi:mesoderm induction early response protein 1 [Anopheles aquasalis]|uniref:mesoderm induction early response protein 1 n=1 Tax=Anopheles aquasalis TaxID=42839 RepID=UPI00215A54F7|nr:mesoderm induction early response protein 1 [Anopheles aquasalis]
MPSEEEQQATGTVVTAPASSEESIDKKPPQTPTADHKEQSPEPQTNPEPPSRLVVPQITTQPSDSETAPIPPPPSSDETHPTETRTSPAGEAVRPATGPDTNEEPLASETRSKSATEGPMTVEQETKTSDAASEERGNNAVAEKQQSVAAPTVSVVAANEEDEDEDEEEDEEAGDNEEQEERGGSREDGYSEGGRGGSGNRQQQSDTPTGGQYYEDDEEDDEDEGEEPSELRQLFEPINDSQAQSEDEEDGDYIPDEEVKKTIMVGSDFQAVIPEGLCRYDDALPYENEDKLLWNPTVLNEQEIEDFLVKITAAPGIVVGAGAGTPKSGTDPQANSVYAIPLGSHLRDDEQSLYLLQQCGHNIDEALRRRRITNNAVPAPEQQMSIWSEEECRNFENGLRVHGKDFHMIQQTKVRTRSVGELVQFYYLWKKTERHDLFASKARLEKKKYNLHPGLTDHMDRFLEEQENSTGFGDRSSSPGFNSLYSSASEAKRQRLLDSKEHTASSKRAASNL